MIEVLVLTFFVAQIRGLLRERVQFAAEEERDRRWDAEHLRRG